MSNKKYTGWQNFATIQFKEIISELVDAKEEQKAIMLIANTGLGKSHAIKQFCTKNPKHTYLVTLGDSYNLTALINELLELLGLKPWHGKNSRHRRLKDLANGLIEVGENGAKPIIILDEAENAKMPMLKAFKELYDAVKDHCSITLIGTDQLIDAINKKWVGQSIPQLRRRFKAGTRFITPFSKVRDMKPFLNAYIPNEQDLQDLLIELCENYGELHDYLDSFLRHCDKKNLQPTEENFRLYFKIPKLKK